MYRLLGIILSLIPVLLHSSCGNAPPSYNIENGKVTPVLLLPGQSGFVFSMYGSSNAPYAPTNFPTFQSLVNAMISQNIGNGFDPGPSPFGSYPLQYNYLATVGWPMTWYVSSAAPIANGGVSISPTQAAQLEPMMAANCFTATQLGEWGYYFHNLSDNCCWWVAAAYCGCTPSTISPCPQAGCSGSAPSPCDPLCATCPAFEMYKSQMAPYGCAGYQVPYTENNPASCYSTMQDYFNNRLTALTDNGTLNLISVTGHSHYEAYAGEWGAKCIGLEVGENIAFTQSKIAFARAASLQWQVPWSLQMSPWLDGYETNWQNLNLGHSWSLANRMWLYGWFAGAAMVTPENSINTFFDFNQPLWVLNEYGQMGSSFFQFTKSHDRGVPYIPVAIVMDHLTGYNGYMKYQWGYLDSGSDLPPQPYQQIRDLFDFQIYPNSDFIWYPYNVTCPSGDANPSEYESRYLVSTPYGEIFNVHLSNVSPAVLASYPVILLVGSIDFTSCNFLTTLEYALESGSLLLISEDQKAALGSNYALLTQRGTVEILAPSTVPGTSPPRPAAISNERLAALTLQTIPFVITGSPIQYTVNQNQAGWVVQLINNAGVSKCPQTAAVIDPEQAATIQITTSLPFSSASEWISGTVHSDASSLTVNIPSGSVEFVQYYSESSNVNSGLYNFTRLKQIYDIQLSNTQTQLRQAGK